MPSRTVFRSTCSRRAGRVVTAQPFMSSRPQFFVAAVGSVRLNLTLGVADMPRNSAGVEQVFWLSLCSTLSLAVGGRIRSC